MIFKIWTTWYKKLRDYFDPPQSGDVDFKYYTRTGECNQCGMCCDDIYLIHQEKVIKDVETFEKLKNDFNDYKYFTPMETDKMGVRFQCVNLQEDKSCAIHDDRPLFCKKYPSEDTLLMGGKLAPDCSYLFKIRTSFAEVMAQTATRKTLRPGRLEYDLLPPGKEPASRQVVR